MSRIKSGLKKLKWLIQDIGFATNLLSLNNAPFNRRLLIYHGVVPKANKKINSRFISTQEFERQLIYFKKHFHLLRLDEYFEGAKDENKLSLSLTFDDGYLNNLNVVLPLLEKYQIPAAFFITTIRETEYSYLWADLLDLHWHTGPKSILFSNLTYRKKRNGYWSEQGSLKALLKSSDWNLKKSFCDFVLANNQFIIEKHLFPYFQLMNEEEIQQLSSSPLVTIGSHGLYHNCMAEVPRNEAKIALEKSKHYLEKLSKREIEYFAYPDGSYNAELIQLAKDVGYTKQVVVDYLQPDDANNPMLSNRFGINPHISFNNQIKSIVDGRY